MTQLQENKFIQTTLSPEDAKKLKIWLINNGISNQRQWLRDLIYRETGIEGEIKDDTE